MYFLVFDMKIVEVRVILLYNNKNIRSVKAESSEIPVDF